MSKFKIGDVVQLKSGGPQMTVMKIEDSEVTCLWFNAKQEEKNGKYHEGLLRKYKASSGYTFGSVF